MMVPIGIVKDHTNKILLVCSVVPLVAKLDSHLIKKLVRVRLCTYK